MENAYMKDFHRSFCVKTPVNLKENGISGHFFLIPESISYRISVNSLGLEG